MQEDLGQVVQERISQVAERRGWPRTVVELLTELDSEVVVALVSLLGVEEAKASKALVQASSGLELLQGQARAYSSIAKLLQSEWSFLHESLSRRE